MTLPELFLQAVITPMMVFDHQSRLSPDFKQLLQDNNISTDELNYHNFDFFLDNTFEPVQTLITSIEEDYVELDKVVKVHDDYLRFTYSMCGADNQELLSVHEIYLVEPKQVTQTSYVRKHLYKEQL